MADYPKRGSHFAHKLVRLMLRSCAAQDIGTDGFALVTAIAHTEDAKRYTGAVTYWNEQLMPILGFTSWSQLDKARDKAIGGGWLHYESGGKRKVGRYWSLIPVDLCDIPDADLSCDYQSSIVQTDDKAKAICGQSADNPKGQAGIECGQSEGTTAKHSTLVLNPSPIPTPNTNTPPNPQGGTAIVDNGHGSNGKQKRQRQPKADAPYSDDFESFWLNFSPVRKVNKPDAWKAWQQVLPSTDAQTIINAAIEFALSPVGLSEFCPGPAPWLRGCRWLDDRRAWQRAGNQGGRIERPESERC